MYAGKEVEEILVCECPAPCSNVACYGPNLFYFELSDGDLFLVEYNVIKKIEGSRRKV